MINDEDEEHERTTRNAREKDSVCMRRSGFKVKLTMNGEIARTKPRTDRMKTIYGILRYNHKRPRINEAALSLVRLKNGMIIILHIIIL